MAKTKRASKKKSVSKVRKVRHVRSQPSIRRARFSLSLLILVVGVPVLARAWSLRCPAAVVGQDPGSTATPLITLPEAAEMDALWRDLGDPGTAGSDGPLGCPLGSGDIVANDKGSQW